LSKRNYTQRNFRQRNFKQRNFGIRIQEIARQVGEITVKVVMPVLRAIDATLPVSLRFLPVSIATDASQSITAIDKSSLYTSQDATQSINIRQFGKIKVVDHGHILRQG